MFTWWKKAGLSKPAQGKPPALRIEINLLTKQSFLWSNDLKNKSPQIQFWGIFPKKTISLIKVDK